MPALACTLSAARVAGLGSTSPVAARGLPPLAVPCRARRVASVRVHAGGSGDNAAGQTAGVSASMVEEQRETGGQGAAVLSTLAAATPLLLFAQDAAAAGGAYGILEGRTGALVHPAMMAFLLGAQVYAGYLGWQWRRARTIPEEVAALKQTLPKAVEGEVAPVLSADQAAAAAKVEALVAERKDILAAGVRDTHFNWGSLLLALGVAIGVEGPVNTYLRTGKLFPGPHLYAGAAIVVLWAAAASCVPQMQKGNDTARTAHIGLNMINLALFAWQVPTGLEIVGKVFQFTKWP